MAFSTHDIVSDSPTNNFATLNPLAYRSGNNFIQYSKGNLRVVQGTSAIAYATFITKIGKWYWEIFIEDNGTVANSDYRGLAEPVSGQSSDGWGNYRFIYNSYNNTYVINGGSFTASDIGTANNPDIIGFFWDADNGYMTVSVNGVAGTTITGLSTGIPMCPAVACNYDTIDIINFGQDPTFGGATGLPTAPSGSPFTDANGIGAFYYQPPTGALALCTANLPDFTPTVTGDTPQDYFKAVLYTGNGGTQSITGVGFQPDLVWVKTRNVTANHALFDSIRGVGNVLQPNTTLNAQTDNDTLTSFDSNGFSLGNATGSYITNTSTYTFVAWCWKAGGPPDLTSSPTKPFAKDGVQYETLSAANITAGTITPTAMSVNTDAGFSIVKYSGNGSIPHGLSSPLDLLIVKVINLDGENWGVWHSSFSSGDFIYLSSTNQKSNNNSKFSGIPSSTVFQVGGDDTTGSSSYNYIAYCWHSVEGYSKFGSFTGNNSADGPFVYTGFRPAFVMLKCSSDTTITHTSWAMYDNARDSSNAMNKVLYANKSINEGYRGDASTAATDIYIDFLSNGFKARSIKEEINDGSETNITYIFMAFAEQPFKFSNAR